MRPTRWQWPPHWRCSTSWPKPLRPRREAGNKLTAHLSALRATVPAISDVRGLGCMVAVEFAKADGTPDADFTKLVQKRAQDAGLLLLTCGVYGNVIRFLFPLTIEDAVLDEGLAILAKALAP